MRRLVTSALVVLLALSATATAAAQEQPRRAGPSLEAYVAEVDEGRLRDLVQRGLDVVARRGERGELLAELILTPQQAEEVEAEEGLELELQAAQVEAEPEGVFRPWSGPGGLDEELTAYAAANPRLVKRVVIGQSVQGQDIVAFRVTRGANRSEDGSKPASLYTATQHAREWITPEMNRRLLRYMVDNYGTDSEITTLLNRNEFWFVPVANPDGYDYTFTEGNRLWRKNLRDNDGDGQITGADGVDPNRNFPYKWGYDNEGSSPNPASQTYRGTAPASEPETQAMLGLYDRVDFSFQINYHSAAELNLYGVGWQVDTRSPDDLISIALAGTDDNPGVPIYDPDLSAELYTTNGETTNHAQEVEGIIAFTPEMSTCQTVSALVPDDEWEAGDCQSVFNFPDDEELIQEEFERNIPFALSIARSTADPDDPQSAVGIVAPDFQVDAFEVAYGSPQTVQVIAKRALGPVVAEYRVNGGRRRVALAREWDGGERYGEQLDQYYAPLRATLRGAGIGDTVEVTFRALGGRRSETFSYSVEEDSDDRVLIIANEDYTGFNPVQDVDAPKYVATYGAALEANGIGYDVWDVDTQGAPHPLGVLSSYDAVVWETGDNRITQGEEDTDVLGDPDLGVADVQQFTTLAVRDFLNEGGKVFYTGEYTSYFGPNGILYYADDDQPDQPCTVESDECLFISNDFFQYYLGLWSRQPVGTPGEVAGTGPPLEGETITVNGGDGADNQDDAGGFVVTSDILPADQFPQFASAEAAVYGTIEDPYQPVEGDWYVGFLHEDNAYERLGRTIDLTGATSAELAFQLSYDTETDYDVVAVEARPVGTEDWTTLPDLGGRTTQGALAACEDGLYEGVHPQTDAYLTSDPATGACTPTGTTGEWNVFDGTSEGWRDVRFDLSAYAGGAVEIQIAYISDIGTAGTGAFVDDTVLTVDGAVVESEGFEGGLGAWSASVAPGSPDVPGAWTRSQSLVEPLDLSAAVTTEDSVTFGFGFEAIATAEQRADVMGRVMGYLLD